ncbi:MAG: diguanylate cyclase, partial [Clostridia bacterium]|nr:diguanylate cyclase [Clostridia bacterium]
GNAYGYATYRLTVTGLLPDQIYGIFVQDEFSAYQLTVNGKPVVSNGSVARTPEGYLPRIFTDVGFFVSDASGQAVLDMEIANFTRSNGGFYNAPVFGTARVIDQYYNLYQASEILIIAFALALGILFALLSLSMKDVRTFLMAVFLFLIAIRSLSTGIHLIQKLLPDLHLTPILVLEYASGYLLVPLAGLLLHAFGIGRFPKLLLWIYRASIPGILLFTSLAPNAMLTASYQVFQILIIPVALHMFWFLYRGVRQREIGISYIVTGFIILIIGALLEFSPFRTRYSLFIAALLFIMSLSVFVVIRLATLQSSHDRLATEVLTDALTGLGNRAALFRQLDQWQKRRDPISLAILFCDLNRFKAVNDTFGHAVGDDLLRLAAKRLQGCVRSTDQVYRVGGDEFVILAEFKADEDATALVTRIKDSFSQPFVLQTLVLHVSVSVGAEPFIPGQESVDNALNRSDARMYEDKRRESAPGNTI